jgi:hypothetical protein
MKDPTVAFEKLQHIQELWRELGRTMSDAPERETLLANIRGLSTEYQALIDSVKKPEKSKGRSA